MSVFAFTKTTEVAETRSNSTVVVALRSVPFTVTLSPPSGLPTVGEIELIVGGLP